MEVTDGKVLVRTTGLASLGGLTGLRLLVCGLGPRKPLPGPAPSALRVESSFRSQPEVPPRRPPQHQYQWVCSYCSLCRPLLGQEPCAGSVL